MFNKYYVTFDMSQEDVPTLIVGRENGGFLSGPCIDIVKVVTGDEAVKLWKELTEKEKRDE